MQTQNERIMAWLETGRPLTQFEALTELSVMRLASRISDLKRDGHNITATMVKVTNRYNEECSVASYQLVKQKETA